MPDWSIKIVPSKSRKPGVLAEFVPDIDGALPGQPLEVETDDLVSWNNTTPEDHWPWPLESEDAQPVDPPPQNQYLTVKAVKPDTPSPWYNVVASDGTIYYCCKLHPAERGKLVVVSFGQPSDSPTS